MVLWVTSGDQKESLVGGAGVEPATSPLLAFGALFQAELSAFARPLQLGHRNFLVHLPFLLRRPLGTRDSAVRSLGSISGKNICASEAQQ